MLGTPSFARRIGFGALFVAMLASAAACGGSKSLVDNFTDKANASDFQASGTISGSMSVTVTGQKIEIPVSGTIAVKGKDTSMVLKTTILGQESTQESVFIGTTSYNRNNGGTWTKSEKGEQTGIMDVMSGGGFSEKGVEAHNGQQLHKIAASKAIDPKILGAGDNVTNAKIDVVFWAKDDGTWAAMTYAGTWDQDMNGTSTPVTMNMSFDFNSYSGVSITAPSV